MTATSNTIKTLNGKKVLVYRGYTQNGVLSSTQYLPSVEFKIGINNGTPNTGNNDLDFPVPITDGTVNDGGDNTLTGSDGGDNSTNNTTTFKPGANQTDDTAQNLIANNTDATKTWTIADLSSDGTIITAAQPFALWLYIVDAAALAKFVTSGTALEVKLGSDPSNYYSKTYVATELSVGWNWITSNTTNVNALTETGTVAGDIDTFIIEITTNNATDAFIAGDVVYDLLRQWATTDLTKIFQTGYPSLDLVNLEVTTRMVVLIGEANGFLLNGIGQFNVDAAPLMTDETTSSGESKSNTDEFIYIEKDRIL